MKDQTADEMAAKRAKMPNGAAGDGAKVVEVTVVDNTGAKVGEVTVGDNTGANVGVTVGDGVGAKVGAPHAAVTTSIPLP